MNYSIIIIQNDYSYWTFLYKSLFACSNVLMKIEQYAKIKRWHKELILTNRQQKNKRKNENENNYKNKVAKVRLPFICFTYGADTSRST